MQRIPRGTQPRHDAIRPPAIQVTPGSTNGRVTEVSGEGLGDGLQVIVDSGSTQS